MRTVLLVFTRHPFRPMMKGMRRRSLVAALLSLAMLSTVSPVASVAGFGDVEDGRHDIDEMSGRAIPRNFRRDFRGPMHKERRRTPALVDEVFVEPERRVARVRPGFAVGVPVFLVAFVDVVEITTTEHAAFLTSAVVGEKHDEGVFKNALLFEETG